MGHTVCAPWIEMLGWAYHPRDAHPAKCSRDPESPGAVLTCSASSAPSLQAFRKLLSTTGPSHPHHPLAQVGKSTLKGFSQSRVLIFVCAHDLHCKGKTQILARRDLRCKQFSHTGSIRKLYNIFSHSFLAPGPALRVQSLSYASFMKRQKNKDLGSQSA